MQYNVCVICLVTQITVNQLLYYAKHNIFLAARYMASCDILWVITPEYQGLLTLLAYPGKIPTIYTSLICSVTNLDDNLGLYVFTSTRNKSWGRQKNKNDILTLKWEQDVQYRIVALYWYSHWNNWEDINIFPGLDIISAPHWYIV